MSPVQVVLLLTLLLGIQPVTTDLYLPALPSLTRALDAPMPAAQLTLSGLIIAFGAAQLVAGPLADRFGRRPVLIVGLALYTAASLGSLQAASIEHLVAWRALQGAGMAAAVTCGRSIVRDLFEPADGARVLSRALSGLGVIAFVSPFVGGALAQWVGWRAPLAAVAVFGAITLGAVLLRLHETVPARNPQATKLAPLAANWVAIAAHPTFRAWALLSMATYAGLFLMLSASSFVYIEVLGQSTIGYSLWLATNSVAYVAGTFLCRRLLVRRGLVGAVRVGGLLSATGGGAMAVLALSGVQAPWAIAGPHLLYALGHGIHQPCGQAGAIGPFPEKAGTAAALSGFLMMATAFGVGLWVGRSLDGTVLPLALGMGVAGLSVGTVAWTLVQRHGDPARGSAARAA
jgi:DHA1 family bicyclomycin/chloramphenicol resistance-like MFS transporter